MSEYGIYQNVEDKDSYAVIVAGRLIGSISHIKARRVYAYQAAGVSTKGEATDLHYAAQALTSVHHA